MRSACMTVDRRCAIRIVIASRRSATSRMVWLISSSVSESSDDVASSKTSRCGPAEQRAGDREALPLAAGHLHAALADHGVETLVGAGEQAVAAPASARPGIPRRWRRADEEQVLADRAGEELRVLGDEADALAEAVEIDVSLVMSVVEDAAGLRLVRPTSSFTRVVFPAPDGPTKAMVSPRRPLNETSASAGADALRCVNATSSKPASSDRLRARDSPAWGPTACSRISWKFAATPPSRGRC